MAMSKTALINEVLAYEDVEGVSRKQVTAIIDHFFEEIGSAVNSGENVTIPGFFSLKLNYRPARTVMSNIEFGNPEAGQEKKNLPMKVAVKINPLKTLKELAPNPTSKAGKALAAAYRERVAAREAAQNGSSGSAKASGKPQAASTGKKAPAGKKTAKRK